MSRIDLIKLVLLVVEFAVSISAVVLFGLAYPNQLRSRLWENGGVEGFNSNPKLRIYFYANHREPPEIPLIWSQRLTDSNLAIALLSLVIFFVRILMLRVGYLPRYGSILYDVLLSTFWIISLVGQNSGDFSDLEHISGHPWYLTRGCSVSWSVNKGYCRLAQGSFALSILAAILYGSRILVEALAWAYDKGQEKERDWMHLDEEKCCNSGAEETEMGSMVKMKDDWQAQALSPVLAFFPSSPSRRHQSI